jgi:ubiquinone/menaquinone biosynthesis C-methylase UbiE
MDKKAVEKILSETERGYNLMAEKFSETRKFFWRGLEFIGDYTKNGDRILDYGCGNGRLLELINNKNVEYIGVDVSQKLIDIAKSKYASDNLNFLKISSSQTSLPFKDNFFNTVYSIAVFHHLPSEELRNKTANELYRVTQPGGYIVVTVWNLWQWSYIKNILKNWLNKLLGKSRLDWNDCYINFKNNQGEVFSRYHHAFTINEIQNIFSTAGFTIEKCEIINGKNIILIGRKQFVAL